MKAEKKEKLLRKFKIQIFVFLVLFIVVELVLRLFGMKAGTLIDDFGIEDNPQYMQRFVSDEMGINHIYPNAETLMLGSVINKQGFRGKFEYTRSSIDSIRKYTGRKIVMMIGDSFVEGCCADSMNNSFPDIVASGPKYEVLNFGVSGTDPLQYELIVRKYLKELMPDIVLVAIYFGNDFLTYERKPSPGTPLTFPFKKNKWIYATATNHLSKKMNYAFKTPAEAYDFYMEHYTLRGKNRNRLQRAMSYSVLLSKIYLFVEHKVKKRAWEQMNQGLYIDVNQITYKNLKNIQLVCDSLSVNYLFAGIPMPSEAKEGQSLTSKYKNYFNEIPYYVPVNLTEKDYDGQSAANHFNNFGHKKYAEFLNKILEEKFEKIGKNGSPK